MTRTDHLRPKRSAKRIIRRAYLFRPEQTTYHSGFAGQGASFGHIVCLSLGSPIHLALLVSCCNAVRSISPRSAIGYRLQDSVAGAPDREQCRCVRPCSDRSGLNSRHVIRY